MREEVTRFEVLLKLPLNEMHRTQVSLFVEGCAISHVDPLAKSSTLLYSTTSGIQVFGPDNFERTHALGDEFYSRH